ncbi:MAG TPA: HAMP domain-containing sensor histidine kinase [Thermoanaerobaculia bacterium]|nr:HAMP domain-containing sensor histidine kinase [Thermoanaerobaculia bacterium]
MIKFPFSNRPSPRVSELAEKLARVLEEDADELVDQWIQWIQQRVGTRTVASLTEQALRNHIPPVLTALARFLRTPSTGAHDHMLGHLSIHAQVRREQGYDIQELLAEFDGLAHLLTRRFQEALLDSAGGGDPDAVVEVFSRLHSGLRAIAFVTVGIYQETQSRLQIELARRLEEYGRTIAHELRNPLNSIVLEAELLSRRDIASAEEERSKHLELIKNAVGRATDLLDNVKTLAFIESTLTDAPLIRLERALSMIVDELAAMAGEREVHIERGELLDVELESMPLQVALVNLLSNAIKYSDPDKPKRWVRVSAELIETGLETPFCQVEVTDNGLGIPPDLQSQIFQRHFRAHPELADGTGLGLAITRQVLQERSGDLEFESTPGEGSTFRFWLRAIDPPGPMPGVADRCANELLRDSIDELESPENDSERTADD